MLNDLPTGTITFLFTDIEGSTQLWERHPEAMKVALARHDELLRRAIEAHNGRIVKTTGDGAYAAFPTASDATAAALDFQQALMAQSWPELTPQTLHARIGLHTGEAELRDGDYHGTTLNRAARLMSAGHGGQILLSAITTELASGSLPETVVLHELGNYRLRGLSGTERIYQLKAPGLPDQFPPLHSAPTRVVDLPQPPTGFIGRWEEVDEILQLLGQPDARLVTLIGPGGMGKTRLAVQVAATVEGRESDRFPDGIFFVPLAPVNSAEAMVPAIASGIGFRFNQHAGEPRRQLLGFLLSRSMLLVLDNLEQLLAVGAAELVMAILDAAPEVRLLATSRSRLGIQGEQLYPVPGMRLPNPATVLTWADPNTEAEQYSGLRLFRQSAARIRSGFRLTRANIADVTRIGHQVQGMPLGIELAAGWLELLSPAEITAEIDRSLDVLATDLRGVPDRQRSMRAVFDTTWTLLSDREREMISALAVFRAPFTREAAEAVAGVPLTALLVLANKSWLQRFQGSDGASRFLVHELLRQYAAEILRLDLAREAAVRRRFANFYADGLVHAIPLLRGPDQLRARDQISADFTHIRNAWDWFLEQGDYDALTERMMLPLYFYDEFHHGGTELFMMVSAAIAARQQQVDPVAVDLSLCKLRAALITLTSRIIIAPVEAEETWAIVSMVPDPIHQLGFWYIGTLLSLSWIGQFDEASHRLRELINGPLPPDHEWLRSQAAAMLGSSLLYTIASPEDIEEPVALLNQACEAFKRAGDKIRYGMVLGDLASAYAKQRNFVKALALLEEQNSLLAPLGLSWRRWPQLGDLYLRSGRIEKMMAVYGEAAQQAHDAGDLPMVSYALSWESIYALRFDTPERARRARMQNLDMAVKYGPFLEENIMAWSYFELGEIERVTGNLKAAADLYEQALPEFQARNDLTGQAYYERGVGDLALAGGNPAAAARHFARALELLPAIISFHGRALTLARLALSETALGEYEAAREHILASLRIVDANNETDLGSHGVLAVVKLAIARGRPETALDLVAALMASPFTWNEVRAESARLAEQAWGMPETAMNAPTEVRGPKIPLDTLISRLISLTDLGVDAWLAGVAAMLAQPVPEQETTRS